MPVQDDQQWGRPARLRRQRIRCYGEQHDDQQWWPGRRGRLASRATAFTWKVWPAVQATKWKSAAVSLVTVHHSYAVIGVKADDAALINALSSVRPFLMTIADTRNPQSAGARNSLRGDCW